MSSGVNSMESPETSGVQEVEEAAKKTDAPAVGETNDIVEIQQKLTDAENQKKELLAKSNDLVGNIVWDKTEKKSTPQFVLHGQEQKEIINFFYHMTDPVNGSSFSITQANGEKYRVTQDSINANKDQKDSIVKAFLSLPTAITNLFYKEKLDGKNLILNGTTGEGIDKTLLTKLNQDATDYQNYQNSIVEKDVVIARYTRLLKSAETTPITLASSDTNHKVSQLKELPPEEQSKITDTLTGVKKSHETYKITNVNIKGYADATPVDNLPFIATEFNRHLTALKTKGFDTSKLPTDYASFPTRLSENRTQINTSAAQDKKRETVTDDTFNHEYTVANRARACTRAMMELDRMDGDQLKELSKAGLKTDIRMSKNTGDTETGGGISFEGIGSTTKESAPEEFTISNETPEVLMNTDLKVVIKIGGTTKIFEYGKQESIKATGALKDVKTSAKLVSQGLQGDYGTIKDKSENMKGTEAVNFGASRGEPTFYVNVEDNMTGLEADDKATITKIDKSTAVPSVTEMLHLLNSLGGSTNETKKFQTIYTS